MLLRRKSLDYVHQEVAKLGDYLVIISTEKAGYRLIISRDGIQKACYDDTFEQFSEALQAADKYIDNKLREFTTILSYFDELDTWIGTSTQNMEI